MSGGSYEYLYCKDISTLLDNPEMLKKMANDLSHLDYAQDVAVETIDFYSDLVAFQVWMETRKARLESIWRAREWWMSADSSEKTFKEELDDWRKEHLLGGKDGAR